MAIIIASGLGLGKIRVCGVSLGMTCVFFAGIFVGHLGFSIDTDMLKYAESFGLVLFVYVLGLQVGPGFFSSFRHGGILLNMLAFGVSLHQHTGEVGSCRRTYCGRYPYRQFRSPIPVSNLYNS